MSNLHLDASAIKTGTINPRRLPPMGGGSVDWTEGFGTYDERYVNVPGDTMTGELIIAVDEAGESPFTIMAPYSPTERLLSVYGGTGPSGMRGEMFLYGNMYVERGFMEVGYLATPPGYLSVAGWGRFGGLIEADGGVKLPAGAPAEVDHATPKSYVDAQVATRLPLTGGTLTGNVSMAAPATLTLASTNQLALNSTDHPFQIGGVLGPNLRMDNTDIQAVNNGVASTLRLNWLGGPVETGSSAFRVWGPLQAMGSATLSADPTLPMQAATKQYVDAMAAGSGDWTLGFPTYDPRYINVDGDTMTGPLVMDRTGTGAGEAISIIDNSGGQLSPFISWFASGTRLGYLQGRPSTVADPGMRLVADQTGGVITFFTDGSETARFTGVVLLVGKTVNQVADAGTQVILSGQSHQVTSVQGANTPNVVCNRVGAGISSGASFVGFRLDNTTIGTITRNAATNAVLYNTTSDYRMKEDRGRITDALDRVMRLVPHRIVWRSDPDQTEMDGFLAHEVAEVVPDAVTGEKDAVSTQDDVEAGNANEIGQIVPQQLDQSKLIPLLVAAVQELASNAGLLGG